MLLMENRHISFYEYSGKKIILKDLFALMNLPMHVFNFREENIIFRTERITIEQDYDIRFRVSFDNYHYDLYYIENSELDFINNPYTNSQILDIEVDLGSFTISNFWCNDDKRKQYYTPS